jgi:hypothetical protein
MFPAAEWSATDTARGLIGFWGLIIGPLVGALAGLALLRGRRGA